MKLGVFFVVGMIAVTATAWAVQPVIDEKGLADDAENRFPQPVVVGTLIGRDVLEPVESQRVLGHVRRLMRQGDNLFVIVDYGGWFGMGARPIAVPANGMTLIGRAMQIVAFKPEQLDSFTTFDPARYTSVKPDETVKIGLAKPAH